MVAIEKIKELLNEYHELCQVPFKTVHETQEMVDKAMELAQYVPELVEEIERSRISFAELHINNWINSDEKGK